MNGQRVPVDTECAFKSKIDLGEKQFWIVLIKSSYSWEMQSFFFSPKYEVPAQLRFNFKALWKEFD